MPKATVIMSCRHTELRERGRVNVYTLQHISGNIIWLRKITYSCSSQSVIWEMELCYLGYLTNVSPTFTLIWALVWPELNPEEKLSKQLYAHMFNSWSNFFHSLPLITIYLSVIGLGSTHTFTCFVNMLMLYTFNQKAGWIKYLDPVVCFVFTWHIICTSCYFKFYCFCLHLILSMLHIEFVWFAFVVCV